MHRRQIEPVDHLHHNPSQVPLGQPLVHRRRKQKSRVAVNRTEIRHAEISMEKKI
jgi:hypothetical protein